MKTNTEIRVVRRSLLMRCLSRRERRRPDPVVRAHRQRMLEGLSGSVIEVGCGEGANFAHYPAAVERVVAVEPDPASRVAARDEATRAPVAVEVIAGIAEDLPAADGSYDAAVCSWVLCTVAEPAVALAELRRVVRPGGELRFYEHVRADGSLQALLQRAVDATFWPRMLGGCRTTRDTEAAIREAGFTIERLERPRHASSRLTVPASPHILGIARTPATPTTTPDERDQPTVRTMHERIIRTYTQHIEAPPAVVFPLICPVREAEWLDGWADAYELIYSASGVAEKNCVFRTHGDVDPEMIWTISEHDPDRGVVEFVRVMAGLVATTLRVAISDGGHGTSSVEIIYLVTPVSDEGARFAAARFGGEALLDAIRWWETSMNHYLRTGELLRTPTTH